MKILYYKIISEHDDDIVQFDISKQSTHSNTHTAYQALSYCRFVVLVADMRLYIYTNPPAI